MTRILAYIHLLRLHRPIGILLLLWPTLMALWIASQGQPNLEVLIIFTLGVVLMRSAGCAINDLIDKKYDKSVARTRNRPLAQGVISNLEVLMIVAALLTAALYLVTRLNILTILWAIFAAGIVVIYPFMKRITHFPQVVLALAFGCSIPMAFTAQNVPLNLACLWLFLAMACWTVVYDTQYAMVDRKYDQRLGLKSTAVLFGRADRTIIFGLQGIVIAFMILLGVQLGRGAFYFISILAAIGLIFYQQYLIKDRKPTACFQAFLNNNVFGAILFIGLAIDFYLSG